MAEQLHILIVPHTHWDREWYQTFQQFRVRLVQTIDHLLDILDRDEKFSYFMLDGQTIVLDDYLEIQPEQEQRLKRHIQAGRILVGPWYLQPDEFLVSGESLIRNLQIGLRRAAEFGTPMRVGYVPDCFGHIAQMPQILQGFGIDSAVFWRGVGEEAHKSEFYWRAPDGSSVLVVFLADPIGYSNARQLPLNPEEFVVRVELLASNIVARATTDTLLLMNGSDHLEPQDGLPATIEAANALLTHLDPQRQQLLVSGHHSKNGQSPRSPEQTKHYSSIQVRLGTLPQYIEQVRQQNSQLETLSGEMRSSQHAHLLPAVLSSRMWIKQQNTATEHLLERWVEPLTAWSSHLGAPYPHGLVRMAWRYLLQNHPHDSICGCSIDQVHRENSVRFAQSQQIGESIVLQAMQQIAAQVDTQSPFPSSYPGHEPVPLVVFNPAPGARNAAVQATVQLPGSLYNAVIVDERGESMPYSVVNRWRQEIGSMPIARDVLATAVMLSGISEPLQLIRMAHGMIMSAQGQSEDTHVISRVYIEDYTDSPLHHVHHTPQPGVIYIEVMIAPKGRVLVNEQELIAAGTQVLALLQREDIHTLEVTLVDQARETIDFVAADLPAYGFKTFWLYPRGLEEEGQQETIKLASRVGGPLVGLGGGGQQETIENEFYLVEVYKQDGTLNVTDKQTGVVFRGLNRFIDGGDIGDLYTYCPPERDTLIREPLEPVKVEVINDGPVRATLRVTGRWALPGGCTSNRAERSARSTICPIISEISLIPGVRRVDIHTSVENKVKDHRLRVIFPVPYKVESAAAEGTFEVRTRPIVQPRPASSSEWAEDPVNVYPQKRFVDLSNGEVGLGVLNRGLPEYEIVSGQDEGPSALALTLLRCVDWLSRGDLALRRGHAGPMEHTPEAQCLGHHEFDYALLPHRGNWYEEESLVLREAQAFNTPVTTRVVVTEPHTGQLASRTSLVVVEPRDIVVSAVKRQNNGEGLVVRIYNPLDHKVQARVFPGIAFKHAYKANLLEECQQPIEITEDPRSVQFDLCGGGISTLVFV